MRRPRPLRPSLALFAAACLVLLAACEDPSGVGLTDLDEGDPRARTLPALDDSLRLAPLDDATGAFLSSTGFADFRGLAGRADDPAYGPISASAYLDVLPPQSVSDDFRGRPVEQATLRLRRAYVYGDTTAATRLDIRQIAEDWDAVGAASDTTFPVLDEVMTSFDVAAADTLVEIALPESWIAQNDTTLRSEEFSTLFHGFRLSPGEPASAVYGFAGDSELELISAEDTVVYRVSELYSNVEAPEPPAFGDLVLLQDGTGRVLNLEFDTDVLDAAVVNNAALRVTADTAAADADQPGFVRPFARELALFGFLDEAEPVIITTARLDEETQTYSFSSSVLTEIFQELSLGRSEVEGFFVGFPTTPSSLDVAPLVAASDPGCDADGGTACAGPRAVLIVTSPDG